MSDEDAPAACPGCGTTPVGPFCHGCGQRIAPGRLRTPRILADAVASALSIESGFLRTFVGLTLRPGTTVREYVAGSRRSHCSPIRYYLTFLAIWALLPPLLGLDLAAVGSDTAATLGVSDTGDAESTAQFERFLGTYAARIRWVVILEVPTLALATRVLFRRWKTTYAEELTVALYAQGHAFVLLCPALLFVAAGLPRVEMALTALALLYVCVVVGSFHAGGPRPHAWPPLLRATAAVGLGHLLWIAAAGAFILASIAPTAVVVP